MTPQGCPIDMEERRRESDRIIRLETVVERIESDMSTLATTYKEIAAQQQNMFIENIKSQSALQTAVQELTRVMQEQKPRVDDLEDHCQVVRTETAKIVALTSKIESLETRMTDTDRWRWKTHGVLIGAFTVIQVVVWLIEHFVF